ncbi:uncharacterized protein FRV6_03379 [Fusarium oxysporum]|uniref:Uncharacterized protein n=1 Tax=Fusarium oxysporum TaxID=5507 RepID=A0A2H3SRR3_FUSOX|nr:uncharacterized protein FRV6_03379 [Fusarium oxysporum]
MASSVRLEDERARSEQSLLDVLDVLDVEGRIDLMGAMYQAPPPVGTASSWLAEVVINQELV